MDKIERYEWKKVGDKGIDKMVPVSELLIDHSYQRPPIEKHILSIARDFDWSAFGSLTVMKRKSGQMYVVDGQQRLGAAKRRGDIKTVPCRIFDSNGPEDEAMAFVDLNIHRMKVTAMQRFIAQCEAGLDPEKTISEWCSQNAFVITDSGKVQGKIDFPSQLIDTWNKNKDRCKEALILQREIIGSDVMNSYIHKGLFYLLWNNIDIGAETRKLILSGGKPAILRAIKLIEIETGQKASARISALGILSVVNFKRRGRRLLLPSDNLIQNKIIA